MDNKSIEAVARRMASIYGDPDALFVSGDAERVTVPGSFGHIINLEYARPLWAAYLALARELNSQRTER